MPVNSPQISPVSLNDSFAQLKSRVSEIINVVNGLPATTDQALTRLGGTIDGLASGAISAGASGSVFVINNGSIGIGEFITDVDSTTSTLGLFHVRRVSGYANVYVESGATSGETGGVANAAIVMVRDTDGANNYVKLGAYSDGSTGASGGSESTVPVIVHTQTADSGATKEYQELIRLERQSDSDIGASEVQAGYISYRSSDSDNGDANFDHVRIVGRSSGDDETSGVFEIWVADGGTPAKELTTNTTGLFMSSNITVEDSTDATSSTDGALDVFGGAAIRKKLFVGGIGTISDTTESTGSTDGSLQVKGGASVVKNLFVGSNVTVESASAATSSSDGALHVVGGAAIGDDLFVGSDTTIESAQAGTAGGAGALMIPSGGHYIGGTSFYGASALLAILNQTDATFGNDNLGGALQVSGGGTFQGKVKFTDEVEFRGNTTFTEPAPYPIGYCEGRWTPNHISTTQFLVNSLHARDQDNTMNMDFSSPIYKEFDTAWSEGSFGGAFPTGATRTANTWYRVFAIGNATTGDVDLGVDDADEDDATNLLNDAPSGWDAYLQLGWLHSDQVTSTSMNFWTASRSDPNYIGLARADLEPTSWDDNAGTWPSTVVGVDSGVDLPPSVHGIFTARHNWELGTDETVYIYLADAGLSSAASSDRYTHIFRRESTHDQRYDFYVEIPVSGGTTPLVHFSVSDASPGGTPELTLKPIGYRFKPGSGA